MHVLSVSKVIDIKVFSFYYDLWKMMAACIFLIYSLLPGPRNVRDFLKHWNTMQQQHQQFYLQSGTLSIITPPRLISSLII